MHSTSSFGRRYASKYAFSSGINLILIVLILAFNALVNKLTGARIDSGIGGDSK